MADSNKVHDFRSLPHKTLANLTAGEVRAEAEGAGHAAWMPTPVAEKTADGVLTLRGQVNAQKFKSEIAERGKPFRYNPTKERVVLLREKVGVTYDGREVVEVATQDGKVFLTGRYMLADWAR